MLSYEAAKWQKDSQSVSAYPGLLWFYGRQTHTLNWAQWELALAMITFFFRN